MILSLADFSGMMPIREPILLPDSYAQYSRNTWLYKGGIRGFRISQQVFTLVRPNTSKQVYRIPLNDANPADFINSLWLEFPDEYFKVLRNPTVGDQYNRYYFFPSSSFVDDGGGWPSVPSYAPLSNIQAGRPYYILGIPTPDNAPLVSPAPLVAPNPLEYRSYVYTYVSAYGEEGPPSPSTTNSGDPINPWTITVYSPSNVNLTNRNLASIRLYRTVTDSSGNAQFFQVDTIPITTPGASIVYIDNFAANQITNNVILPSVYYTGPPVGLQGVVMMANGIMAGWTNDREVWFSGAYVPHAWPATYALTVDFPIVGMAAIGNSLNIITEGQPFIASGMTPDTMTIGKVTANEPGISRGSIFPAGEGVYYASPNGLILLNTSGTINTTQNLMEREFWDSLQPELWACGRTAMSYFAFVKGYIPTAADDTNGLVIDHLEKNVPFSHIRTSLNPVVNLYWDEISGQLFYISQGVVRWINPPDGGFLLPWLWISRIFRMPKPIQFKVFKVSFTIPSELTIPPPTAASRNNDQAQVFDSTKQYLIARVYRGVNSIQENTPDPVVVREIIQSDEILTIPGGFKDDFWSFEFEGQVNVNSIKVASSVKELQKG
jgi:hypothetical protein